MNGKRLFVLSTTTTNRKEANWRFRFSPLAYNAHFILAKIIIIAVMTRKWDNPTKIHSELIKLG